MINSLIVLEKKAMQATTTIKEVILKYRFMTIVFDDYVTKVLSKMELLKTTFY